MKPNPIDKSKNYWAFVSYSSKDKRWGQWLHRRLENYPIPPEFRGLEVFDGAVLGKNLRPVFRDRDEFAGSTNLDEAIHDALEASRFLVVLCSKNSANSEWVEKEIKAFRTLGKGDRILALILDGEPNATAKGRAAEECFPPALRYPVDPIAGDLRKEGDGKARGFLKILAGIAQLDFDKLYRRHERAQAKKRLVVGAVALALIASFAGLSIFAWSQRMLAETRQQEKGEQRDQSWLREAKFSWLPRAQESMAKKLHPYSLIYAARGLGFNGYGVDSLPVRCKADFEGAYPKLFDTKKYPELDKEFRGCIDQGSQKPCLPIWVNSRSPEETAGVMSVVFHPDGRTFASGSGNGVIGIWDVASGRKMTVMTNHTAKVSSLAYSSDGTLLASAGWDHIIRVWRVAVPEEGAELLGHTNAVQSVCFNPDSRLLASGSLDGTVRIWDIETHKEIAVFAGGGGPSGIVAFNADGTLLASGGSDNKIHLWDVAAKKERRVLNQHRATVAGLCFSPNGVSLASASIDDTVYLWNLASQEPPILLLQHYGSRSLLNRPCESGVGSSLSFSPDGSVIACISTEVFEERVFASRDGAVILDDHETGVIRIFEQEDNPKEYPHINFKEKAMLIGPHSSPLSIGFSPDGRTLVSGSVGGGICLWDVHRVRVPVHRTKGPGNVEFSNIVGYFKKDNGDEVAGEITPMWNRDSFCFDLAGYINLGWYAFNDRTGRCEPGEPSQEGFLNVGPWSHVAILRGAATPEQHKNRLFKHYLDVGAYAASMLLLDMVNWRQSDKAQTDAFLQWAVSSPYTQNLARMLDMGISAKTKLANGDTLLMFACSNMKPDNTELLLKYGADPNGVGNKGETALMRAARLGRAETVRALIEHGAQLEAQDNSGLTPLMQTCKAPKNQIIPVNQHGPSSDETAIIHDLLMAGANPNTASTNGWTALMYAASFGKTNVSAQLLSAGAQIGQTNAVGSTALAIASQKGLHLCMEFLLAHGADVNVQRKDGATPLLLACKYLDLDPHCSEVVRILLEKGAKAEIADQSGLTPLMSACSGNGSGQMEVIQQLLAAGASVNAVSTNSFTPLTLAARDAPAPVGRLLLDHGAKIDHKETTGDSALSIAAHMGREDFCRLLIEGGADADVRNNLGITPLILACAFQKNDLSNIVALLLKNGASVECAVKNGWRALMFAAQLGHIETGKVLIEYGAEIDARMNDGGTALGVAAGGGRTKFCRLLLERGAELEVRDNNTFTPLMLACNNSERDQAKTVALLLEKGANIEAAGKDGWRPLMIAAQHGLLETGKLLLEHGAKINAQKEDGMTALSVAAGNGRAKFARVLLQHSADARHIEFLGYTAATWASGAGNCPELLPDLFGVKSFSVEAIKARAETCEAAIGAQMIVEALVCASDLANKESRGRVARELLEEALEQVPVSHPYATRLRQLVLERLAGVCLQEKDYRAALDHLTHYMVLLRVSVSEHPELKGKLCDVGSHLCWLSTLAGKHAEALAAGEEAVALLKDDSACPARMNLAHAYLFNGQFDKAKAIYKKYFGAAFENGRKWNDEVRSDFKLIREAGQDHPDIKKIEALLEGGGE